MLDVISLQKVSLTMPHKLFPFLPTKLAIFERYIPE
jgi:hypothetical protein